MNKVIEILDEDTGIDYRSVKSLLKKLNSVDEEKEKITSLTIKLNFSSISELSEVILWRCCIYFKGFDCKKVFDISNKSSSVILAKTGFFNRLIGQNSSLLSFEKVNPLHYDIFKPYLEEGEEGSLTEEKLEEIFEDNFDKHIDNNNPFHREARIHIKEILNNAFDHSQVQSDAGLICKVDEVNISFAVADMGQGFRGSFLSNPSLKEVYNLFSDQDLLEKATCFQVSCNPSSSPNPKYKHKNAGSGLFYLRKFVELHKNNKLVLISDKGYFYVDGQGRLKRRNLEAVKWPGAVVHFQFNKNQTKSEEYVKLCKSVYDATEIDKSYITIV